MIEDLCWLHRSYLLERVPEFGVRVAVPTDAKEELKIEAGMILARSRIEKLYGVEVPDDNVDLMVAEKCYTEQLAVLRWVLDNDTEWEEEGLRDT
jgi:hypothetical protein